MDNKPYIFNGLVVPFFYQEKGSDGSKVYSLNLPNLDWVLSIVLCSDGHIDVEVYRDLEDFRDRSASELELCSNIDNMEEFTYFLQDGQFHIEGYINDDYSESED